MKSSKMTTTLIVWTMFLSFWMIILFLDGAFSYKNQERVAPIDTVALPQSLTDIPSTGTAVGGLPDMISGAIHQSLANSEIFQDMRVLEYLYTQNQNVELLQPLVEKFLQYYQFDKANHYLDLLLQNTSWHSSLSIEPHQIVYARLNDLTLGLDSISALDEIFLLIQDYKQTGLLTQDDVSFYQWLQALWSYNYSGASAAFAQVTGARYQDFKRAYEASLAHYGSIKNPPVYYRDGLVSLTLLKNGYFMFAKRLALHALAQNTKYILPYQVLAYTNFLTHNRETAKDYFLKLADFDIHNAPMYKFLIGICYYRYGDYEQSIIYLTQIDTPALQLDVYRYMLLGYIQGDDSSNMIRIRQKLLGQPNLQPSDFSLLFDQLFYLPFRSGKPFALYAENPQLPDLYLRKCIDIFSGSQSDVCTYGQVWLQLAQQNLSWVGKELLSLAQLYHQSHLYHLLGDYYLQSKDEASAKTYYIKALSISDTLNEQTIIKHKLLQLSPQ